LGVGAALGFGDAFVSATFGLATFGLATFGFTALVELAGAMGIVVVLRTIGTVVWARAMKLLLLCSA
jgi:hypothetical protein